MSQEKQQRVPQEPSTKRRGRPARPPSQRNCAIYQRVRFDGQSYEKVGGEYALARQTVADIIAQVEGWIAAHPTHPLAQKMRVRCGQRWETLWAWAIEAFDRSRQDREINKQRTARRAASGAAEAVTTITEQTVRKQNGDPRYLNIACRAAEREDQLWMPQPSGSIRKPTCQAEADTASGPSDMLEPSPMVAAMRQRFSYLPAGLCDLAHLACGLRNATEGAACHRPSGTESEVDRQPNRTESVSHRGSKGAASSSGETATPVSVAFEQRCAEAFRCLGFDVRQLGQGCGRVADCLAVATSERFAVIIDAKVRRKGYTLGTDDRQFCEYATRHSRELAQSGIERVYFAVVGHGFRQTDLGKLAGFMTGTPIRSVVFLEVEALMRLVDESIRRRREFRLGEIDQLLFGNKIIRA